MEEIILENEQRVLRDFESFAENDVSNILLLGSYGTGKSYLVEKYKELLHKNDLIIIKDTIEDIRETVEDVIQNKPNALVCFDNIETYSLNHFSVILKFLEMENINYNVILTVDSNFEIPEVIRTRCKIVNLQNPSKQDIQNYEKSKNWDKIQYLSFKLLDMIDNYKDVDVIAETPVQFFNYLDSMPQKIENNYESILNIAFKLKDNLTDGLKESQMRLAIRYIANLMDKKEIYELVNEDFNYYKKDNISDMYMIEKFLFECRYIMEIKENQECIKI